MKKITVIVPVYNVMPYLENSLASLLGQTIFEDLEILLIDDGSTDGSGVFCESLAKQYPNISYIYQKNAGVSVARNVGLRMATAPYIGFFDPDDILEADMYEKMLTDMVRLSADMVSVLWASPVYSPARDRNPDLEHTTYMQEKSYDIMADYLSDRSFTPSVVDKLFSRSLLTDLFFAEDIRVHEDGLFVFSALQRAKRVYYDTRKVYYHVILSAESATRKRFHAGRFDAIKAIRRMEEACEDASLQRYARAYLMNYMIVLLLLIYRQGAEKEFAHDVKEMKAYLYAYAYRENKAFLPHNITRKRLQYFGICPRLFLTAALWRERLRYRMRKWIAR